MYVETSVFSYLAGRTSRDLIVAARQQRTRTWWQTRRMVFDLYVSQVVIDEAQAGDPLVASKRSELLAAVPILDIPEGVADLAAALIAGVPVPRKAAADAAHIAVAAYHRRRIEAVCRASGHPAPILCTPDELMGDTT